VTDRTKVVASAISKPATAMPAALFGCRTEMAGEAATIPGARWNVVVGRAIARTTQSSAKTAEPAGVGSFRSLTGPANVPAHSRSHGVSALRLLGSPHRGVPGRSRPRGALSGK
jgi:hypothetical protein